MTTTTPTAFPAAPAPRTIQGPFSHWPRRTTATHRPAPRRRQLAGLAALIGGTGIFFHCVAPLIF